MKKVLTYAIPIASIAWLTAIFVFYRNEPMSLSEYLQMITFAAIMIVAYAITTKEE